MDLDENPRSTWGASQAYRDAWNEKFGKKDEDGDSADAEDDTEADPSEDTDTQPEKYGTQLDATGDVSFT